MNMRILFLTNLIACLSIVFSLSLHSQIGTRFPSEMKVVTDPVTGTRLTFLTSKPSGDSKIYQTHRQWSADGKWVIFRSNRVQGEAMAVNEKTGVIVQVSEGGFTGMLNVAQKSMKLYFMRFVRQEQGQSRNRSIQVVGVDLEKLFADSETGQLKNADAYQRICGTTPAELGAGGDMALDAGEEVVYFRTGREEAVKHLSAGTKMESSFGPRNMGAGPSGIAGMNIKTGQGEFRGGGSFPDRAYPNQSVGYRRNSVLLGNWRESAPENLDCYGRRDRSAAPIS